MKTNPSQAASGHRKTSRGQAMVEMIIGLVAILVVFMGILQIQQLARAQTRTQIDARQEAGAAAMQETYGLTGPGPYFIGDWQVGRDQKAYSRDDTRTMISQQMITDLITLHAKPNELVARLPTNAVSALMSTTSTVSQMYLVHGHEQSAALPLLPVIRRLLYQADSIQIESDSWLSWTKIE